jgi:hypothetical protein
VCEETTFPPCCFFCSKKKKTLFYKKRIEKNLAPNPLVDPSGLQLGLSVNIFTNKNGGLTKERGSGIHNFIKKKFLVKLYIGKKNRKITLRNLGFITNFR